MPDQKPLPMVIGATENALRALLGELLIETPIRSYDRWVALSVIARCTDSQDEARSVLADTLKIDAVGVDALCSALESEGLISSAGDDIYVSAAGGTAIEQTRPRVGSVTAGLVGKIPPESVEVAVRVLDQVRMGAESVLADLGVRRRP